MNDSKKYFRLGPSLCLILILLSFSLATEQPLQAQASSSSSSTDNLNYFLSLAGGAAIGGALGAISGDNKVTGKAALVGGGAASAMFLHYKQTGNVGLYKEITSFSILGLGLGWSMTDSMKGAGYGALAGFGGATLWVVIHP
jgi:hypothetical protein